MYIYRICLAARPHRSPSRLTAFKQKGHMNGDQSINHDPPQPHTNLHVKYAEQRRKYGIRVNPGG